MHNIHKQTNNIKLNITKLFPSSQYTIIHSPGTIIILILAKYVLFFKSWTLKLSIVSRIKQQW